MELVSIITPCYNAASFISQAIESVIAQTYPNWEMLIIDDCSTDNSAMIVRAYIEKDSRIRYFKTGYASGSPTKPRNLGIFEAKGKYIAFLDSDDIWFPNKLEMQLPLFREKIAIVYSYYEKMSEEGVCSGRIVRSADYHSYKSLLYGNEIGCLTAVIDTSKVGKCYFEEIGHEDYVYWLSILKKGYIAQNTKTVVAKYRIRKSSVSLNKLQAISWVWCIYRNSEGLSIPIASFYLCSDLFKSFLKALI